MAPLRQLLAASLAVLSVSASAVLDLTPSNFDDIVLKSGKPALVEFFAPWCGHCKNLAPIYDQLADSLESQKDKVTIAKVDADDHKELGRKFGVQGFPTLKWFDGKSDTPEDYKSGRDLESLTAFVSEKTGVKPKAAKKAPSSVEVLTDATFKQTIGGDKDVLVAYTAPWCGHCKSLKPTWEKVAEDFASEPSVVIANVDAEAPNSKATAQDAGVSSYPTLKFYPKGSTEAVAYTGGRSEADLISFMNDKAGTHRVAGGGLDATAGTIASLDDIVGHLKTGGATVQDQLVAAAKGLQDKYAVYYTKVAEKMSANGDYVDKELNRIAGLLKKGGLAPEKIDDLMSRSNILNKFKGDAESRKDEL